MDYQLLLKTFNLEPDEPQMIILGVVFVAVLLRALKSSLFDPYLNLIESREKGAADTTAKAASLRREYESRVSTARIEAMKKKLATLASARTEASAIADKAEGSAQEEIRKVRWDLASRMDELRGGASKEVDAMVESIVKRIKTGGEARY